MRLRATIWVVFALQFAGAAEPAAINPKTLSPGLSAVYRSIADDSSVRRIEAKPVLAIGDSSPHPRIPAGPFSVEWSGVIQLRGDGPFTFDAFLGGELTLSIDDAVVLKGRGESETAQVKSTEPFAHKAGRYHIKIEYRSLPKVPARLQIWWQGSGFGREPLPPWILKHQSEESLEAKQDATAESGRMLVGRLGCAQCHADAFPAIHEPPPGPSLAGIGSRASREWLFSFLGNPFTKPSERMHAVFKADREGAVERWIITDYLIKENARKDPPKNAPGDHRQGAKDFLRTGCAACHFAPDIKRDQQKDLDRTDFEGLADRLPGPHLVEFLESPASRYPDERHPKFPLPTQSARDIAAYLLLWYKPSSASGPDPAVTPEEIEKAAQRLDVNGADTAAKKLLQSRGCASCHAGLGDIQPLKVPLAPDKNGGCITFTGPVRFALYDKEREAIGAYRQVALKEKFPSPAEERRQLILRLGCLRCHSNDDQQPPLEQVSSTLGGSHLETVPFLRVPRLNNAILKYTHEFLKNSISDGVSGVRYKGYSFRMPLYGSRTDEIIRAVAEMEGDLVNATPSQPAADDPTLSGPGASLVGFEGYSCISCHTWNGAKFNDGDPGAIGPDLATVATRVRHDWFDRWIDEPGRIVPGTVMPQIFMRGEPAKIQSVLDGDPSKQKQAIWAYLSLGKNAPSPKPMPAIPIDIPPPGSPPMVAQIPVRLADKKDVESICIVYGTHDLLLYDVGELKLRGAYTAAQILRSVRGRVRGNALGGTPVPDFSATAAASLLEPKPKSVELLGYDRLPDGARIRLKANFDARSIEGSEIFRLKDRKIEHEIHWPDLPTKSISYALPPAANPPDAKYPLMPDPGPVGGSLERPGYRAIAYPRPKTITGEDLLMPGAVAVHPVDGRVFVSSMKNGELFVLNDPKDDGTGACFENYAGGLFHDALAMMCEKDGLYVLHRRNLTKIIETDGKATRFDRIFALPQGVTDAYDYGYGLVRDKTGAFVFTHAAYGNRKMPGAGSAIRMIPGKEPEEIAYGFRNPLGWCTGPEGEIFYTDNQGDWVATNKLSHIVKGRYYGFPINEQKEHWTKPPAKTALWVPYGWARSINGVTYNTSDKFGPFQNQFFLAELMYGGAIIRASLEKVNGEYQGACFPFWGKGLLGPLTLAFDPKGRLFVGSITEPGWMAMPDRGALYRIDFTGETPFEIQSVNVMPRGFRLNFTQEIDAETAALAASYSIEHYRYEYTGAYGSPELDRTGMAIEKVTISADKKSIELQTGALTKERVYMISAPGVKSKKGTLLVNPTGAYTLNEVPEN